MEKVPRVYPSEEPFKVPYIWILVPFNTSTHLKLFQIYKTILVRFVKSRFFFQCYSQGSGWTGLSPAQSNPWARLGERIVLVGARGPKLLAHGLTVSWKKYFAWNRMMLYTLAQNKSQSKRSCIHNLFLHFELIFMRFSKFEIWLGWSVLYDLFLDFWFDSIPSTDIKKYVHNSVVRSLLCKSRKSEICPNLEHA